MSTDLHKLLTEPIKEHLIRFEEVYRESLKSDIKLINTIIRYISKKKGKQIRSNLCLLSASLCGEPTESTFRAAALIEIMHVATLIHDDVVDDAEIRRGWPSINRVWKNKLAILVGDFMFSKTLTNMIYLKNFDALELLSSTAKRLSQGEINQIEKAIKKNMTEDVYYQMVSDKTASLFSAACKLGAMTVTGDQNQCSTLEKFGEKFGLVFQIKDDLLDITGNVNGLGKPSGFDLKKNILTLPLIYLFKNLDPSEGKEVRRKLKNHIKKSELKGIKKLVEQHGGIQFAESQIDRISAEARDDLKIFPKTKYKDALISALEFNINRNR